MNTAHWLRKHMTALLGIGMATLFAPGTLAAAQPLPFNQAAVKQSTAPADLGPSASSPYFTVRFALPIPPDNDTQHNGPLVGIDATVADHHHSPGFEVMPNGDALIVSFSGPSGVEGGPRLRIVQARLRHGAEEFDMPEEVDIQGVRMQDLIRTDGNHALHGPPLLWREGTNVWLFTGGHQWQPVGESPRRGGFRVFKSADNGASWTTVALEPTFSALSADAQPITSAFRDNSGNLYVACDGPDGATSSMLWKSSNNGSSWTDMGGRTGGRHSTIVPLNTSGQLLSLGGKDVNMDGYMCKNTSTNWGATWGSNVKSPFPRLGGNQRPSVIRLASGNLVMVGDSRHLSLPNTTPPGWTYGDMPYVARSTDNGSSWTIKALPVALKHEHRLHKTIGYATVRQAPNGVIHLFATMTHPCLHYEFNEAWINSTEGDIAPETTGGTVQSYSETYSGGAPKAMWSARRTPGGRYLLDGVETHFYADGKKQREATWVSGRRTGPETLWGPDGARIWSWNHDLANNVSTWTHWWSTGQKRLESQWNTNPVARDLSSRNFRGLVAHGTARHWDTSGQLTGEYAFLNGDRIVPLGNKKETFAATPSGWTGSGNTTGGNNFALSNSTSWCQNSNASYMTDKGEIGGVFARSSTYRYYADTAIGTKYRTETLRLSGLLRVEEANFDGAFYIGYFNTSTPGSNFIGLEIRESAGYRLDPLLNESGTLLRCYLTVKGPGGTVSSEPIELYTGSGNSGKAFDLIWRGDANGAGTLSGAVQSVPMPSITVAAGSGSFNAFGVLCGGMSSSDVNQKTGSCWFDNLTYDKGTVTTYTVAYNANGGTGSAPSTQTKPSGVNIPVSANIGNLVKANSTFAGWNTNTGGTGTTYAPGTLYTANANVTLYAKWAAATTYNVTYNVNNATGGTAPATQIKTQNVALTLAANSGNLARSGYAFAGWNTAANGSGTDYAEGAMYTANANLPLYAKWAQIPSKTLKIMPMGDSITQGTIPGGYRLPLYNLLQGGGYTFDFVGSKSQSGDTCPDVNHWGQAGWQISDTPATVDGRSYVSIQGVNRSGLYDEMSSAISTTYFSANTSTHRNIVLLMAGINDVLHQVVDDRYGSYNTDTDLNGFGDGQEWVAEGCIARLKALLNSINSLASSRNLRIEVVLGTICPLTKDWDRLPEDGDAVSDVMIAEVEQYNGFIQSVIPTMSFSNLSVKIVDQYAATLGKLADGVHPNADGYSAMAQVWYQAIGAPAFCVVTFDAGVGATASLASKVVSVGAAYGPLATTSRSGYTFAGWWTGSGGTGSEVTATTVVGNASNHTLYAKWTSASSGPLYWDNAGGTANDWGGVANWSTVVGGGANPAAIPGASDVATFSATPIQGAAQTVNLNVDRSARGISVLSGVTATTTLLGGGVNRALTLGDAGITNAGSAALTIGSGTSGQNVAITLSASQNIAANGSGGITIANNVSGTGSPTLANNGTGSGFINLSGALQSTVGKIVQDSATSTLSPRGNNSGFTGNVEILKGTLSIGTHANNLGTSAGQVILGGSGADVATLDINDNANITYAAKPIVLGTTSGALKIVLRDSGGAVYTHTLTGGITGDNALILETQGGDDKLTFSTGALNNAGTITHTGDGAGDLTIDAVIGSNVTGMIQNSATSKMVLTGANAYGGDTTVNAGTLAVNGNAIPDSGKLVVQSGGKVGIASGTETVGTLFFGTTQQVAGTWGSTASAADNKNDTYFTGAGVVSVTTGPAASGMRYWDNNGGTANDWGGVANWSTVVGGGANPAAIPGESDVAAFSATPIQGTAQTVNLNADRSARGLSVLSGVTATTTLLGGGVNRALTLGDAGITNAGSAALTIGSGTSGQNVAITLSASQNIAADGSGGITIINNVSGTGSPTLTNKGTGSGFINLSGALQSTVGKIVQDSATSTLSPRGNNSGFAGDVDILRGTVLIGTHANNLGGAAGQVNLGSSAPGATAAATLEINDNANITYAAKPIVLGTTSGLLKIVHRDEGGGVYTHTLTGGITGNNALTLETQGGDDKLTFSTGALNNAGTITHTGDGAGDLTINAAIGANVTGVVQNSATSKMVLTGANTYSGDTTVNAGTLAVNGNAIPDSGKLVINSGGKVGIASGTETVGTLFFGAAQQVAGTWGSTASAADNKDDTYFTGAGVVSVTTGPAAGEVTETFDTAATTEANGWAGSGNAAGGNNFGWADTNVVLGAGTGGAAGGIFARSVSFSHFADTTIGTFDRTSALRLAGSFRLANVNFDGTFRLGYFTPGEGATNFVGIQVVEPSGAGNPFRGYAGVDGTGGAGSGMIELTQNTTLSFDLTWTGSADGSGTLSGTLAGTNVNVSVGAGSGGFTAFGLLCGGAGSNNSTLRTGGCYFDSLTYENFMAVGTGTTQRQTISFGAIADQLVTRTLTLGGTATSGLPVEHEVTEGPGVLDGASLSFTGSGYVTVRATQGGDDAFLPAPPVEHRFAVLTEEGILDVGGNGVDDRWELTHWPDSTPPETVLKRGRPMSLRDVFVADLDPFDPQSVLEITDFGLVWKDGVWQTAVAFAPASARRLYDLETKAQLTNAWQRLVGDIVPDAATFRIETPDAGETQRFFRIQVRLPPPAE